MRRNKSTGLVLVIIIILLSSMFVFASGKPEEDMYTNKSISEMIKKFGNPLSDTIKIIDEKYSPYESEPDYSIYFSLTELQESVHVRVLIWHKRNRKIRVWAKEKNNEWVVFSSLNSGENVEF